MGEICIPVTQGFVCIDSSQNSDGQNQNQNSGFPAQEFIKRTFSLCIKRSLAVIFRLASVRFVFARPRGVLYPILLYPLLLYPLLLYPLLLPPILLYPLLLPPAFCQLLLTLSESLPAAASAGTPFLAPGWYGFCLVSFFPPAPLPFYVFQQSPHLALPIYSNPVFLQTCGTDTVPFCKGAGKCAVIDLPASAGRASLL